ncbi:MAG: hypothetical protein U0K87_00785 [Ruminococcus sp.]|nr:hypothetical protein [Ruminococcus sp.]
MKYRIILFLNSLIVCLLQLIPNTIICATATGDPDKLIYNRYSFYWDIQLWGMGSFWYPLISFLSLLTLCFAVIMLIRGSQWSKIAILAATTPQILLMLIPIHAMAGDSNRFSIVLVLMLVLMISEFVLSIISIVKGFLGR